MSTMILAAVLCVGMAGCELFNPIGPIIQIGMYWVEGEAHKYYNTDQATITTAVKTVLDDLQFTILEEEAIDDYYWIKATDGSKVSINGEMVESHFKIKIREVKHNITKLSIRVNTFGNRPYVEMIYRHVDKHPKVIQFTTVEELNAAYDKRDR
jgi:hypothetical protein